MAKLTNEQIIKQFKEIHGNKFDYSLVDYKNTHLKVKIICPQKHIFEQTPAAHLQKQGCKYCNQKNDKDQLLEKLLNKNYEFVEYVDCKNVFIKDQYGLLKVKASDIRDSSCNFSIQCAVDKTEYFINRAKSIHQNKYSYNKSIYLRDKEKIIITCPIHGDFEQAPRHHLNGSSCIKCHYHLNGYGKTKFINSCERNNNGLGTLYVVRCFNDNEEFYKIGITGRTIKQRFSGKTFPYKYEIIQEIKDNPLIIYNLENELIKLYKDYSYKPLLSFKGETECYKF